MNTYSGGGAGWGELIVWEKAHALAVEVYRASNAFPKHERYALTSQLLRAATSIPTNIAEGKGRRTRADFRNFITIARGSAEEVRYLLLLSRDLNYLEPSRYEILSASALEVTKMLGKLMGTLA
ncbi:four helix bundle protein [Nibricoccus sp. IMCC34717]|uniref:four helix bundle protein n=1 Tax=Nibricoccus sp. IMCC34717 TaxID=3034021 RepID=UPI00384BC009